MKKNSIVTFPKNYNELNLSLTQTILQEWKHHFLKQTVTVHSNCSQLGNTLWLCLPLAIGPAKAVLKRCPKSLAMICSKNLLWYSWFWNSLQKWLRDDQLVLKLGLKLFSLPGPSGRTATLQLTTWSPQSGLGLVALVTPVKAIWNKCLLKSWCRIITI